MTARLPIAKTYKLFIAGQFPRSESGRSVRIADGAGNTIAHTSQASRKDLRNAVEAAVGAQPKWAASTAYLRAQILYRLAEMMEGKGAELDAAIALGRASGASKRVGARSEVPVAIDRVVHYAGWADKFPQVLGCANPVAGPYHNFTIPEALGIVGVVCPDEHPLLALVSLVAPAICAGNACVVLASPTNPIPACILAEAIVTSDMPPGVINLLTGFRDELVPHFASHREIGAIHAAGVSLEHRRALELGAAENLKRVVVRDVSTGTGTRSGGWFDDDACESPGWIEPFVEFKTIWHPSSA